MSAPAAAASSSSADVDAPDVDEQKQNLSKEQAAEAGQLDKVTDFAEEVEMDEAKSQQVRAKATGHAQCDSGMRPRCAPAVLDPRKALEASVPWVGRESKRRLRESSLTPLSVCSSLSLRC